MLKGRRKQRHGQRKRVAPATKAVTTNALRLPYLPRTGDHLGHKRQRDRGDDAGLIEKGRGDSHQLGGVHCQIQRGKHE